MKCKGATIERLYSNNPSALLSELKRQIGNTKTIVVYGDRNTFTLSTTRTKVIWIKRVGSEYMGLLNIYVPVNGIS